MKLSLSLSNDRIINLSDKPTYYPRYGVLKHLHDVIGKSILETHGYRMLYPNEEIKPVGDPSVFRGVNMNDRNNTFCYFTEQWQKYSYEVIKINVRRKKPLFTENEVSYTARKIFAAGYKGDRFQSNKFGTDTCHDYVNGNNTSREDVRLEYQFTGGNVVQILGEKKNVPGGLPSYPVRCFDGLKSPPDPKAINFLTYPYLVLKATIETRKLKNLNDREVRPFDLVGVSEFPHFLLVKGSDVIWVPEERIRFIDEQQMLSNNPYA